MSQRKTNEELYADTIRDSYDLVQESGTTRAEMESTLDQIANLCTDALPELLMEEAEDGLEADLSDEDEDE